MNDQDKPREQLIAELVELRHRMGGLETQLARSLQAESDQRQINNSLPVLVAMAGLDGYYKEVNAAFESTLGWSEQESLSRPFLEFIHPDDRAAAVETFARLKSGDPAINFLDRNICKDGSHRWINWTVIPVPNRDIVFGIGHDITERKQAEDEHKRAETALRESERRLATLLSNLPGVAYRCKFDPDWTVEFLSDGYADLTGYDNSEQIGQPGTRYVGLIHPQDRQRASEIIQEAIAAKKQFQVEYRLRTASGQERWIWERGTGVFSEIGEPEAIEGFSTDVTEHKRAEASLRQAHDELEQRVKDRTAELTKANGLLQAEVEQRRRTEEELAIFRQFAEASGLGFGMADLDGRVTYVNPTLFRWSHEKTPQDCVGKPLSAYMPTNYRERREKEILPTLGRKGYWQGEETVSLRDGRTIPTIFTVFPVHDESGNLLRTAVVITDITELKRAEEALRQTLNQLETIYDGMIEGLLITDIETKRFVRVNASFCRMLGYSEEELLVAAIKDIHPAEEVPNDERRFLAAAEGRVSINVDRPVLRKDGSIFYADITGRRIFYDGRPCLLALFRDVTERRQAEEKLKSEQRALRRMVLASDHERRLVTYELHDGVAQQLLGAMIYFQSQELPKAQKSKKAETAYREGMEALRRAAGEVRRVMNRLRTPVLDKFGLVEAIEDVAAQLRLAPAAPEIECRDEVKFKRLEPTLENSLFRIAQEAMTNACRHSTSEKVQVTLTQKGDDVTLEVRDWGTGFDLDAVQENRFGLEGIRERSRILGGKLSIKSKPGGGTVVRVKFPVIEATDED